MSSLKHIQTLLFDLDGTLIDSTADLAASGNYIRRQRGLSVLDDPTVASYIGDGVHALIARLLNTQEAAQVDPAVSDFIVHYHHHCLDNTVLYQGVEKTLRELNARGYAMAVVTNKPERISRRIIEGLGLSDCLPVVIGGNTGQAKKPDPEPLHLACKALKKEIKSAAMIGDSHVDVQAGRNAGIPCVAVSFGIGDKEKLNASVPDQLLDQFEQLLELFPGKGK